MRRWEGGREGRVEGGTERESESVRVEEVMYLAFLIRPCWSLQRHNQEKLSRGQSAEVNVDIYDTVKSIIEV